MDLQQYIDTISRRFKLGNATEHSFRGDLQQLIEALSPGIRATNEPKRQACGAPDYIITRKNIPIGYIEAKDIGTDLTAKHHQEQFDRYKTSLNNLIFTDYLDFHLYRDGEFASKVRIAEIRNSKIVPLPDNFPAFTDLITSFCNYTGQTIKSPRKLAEMMAGKARMMAGIIENALIADEKESDFSAHESANITLRQQYKIFQEILIHDITPKGFADIYAQTICYGMFAARLHDPTLDDFSRQEAAELIPATNPFLRKLFQYIAGYDLDDRIKWIVDAVADIFRATDIATLLKNFGRSTQQNDPMIHFYETFLSEYDPKLRKTRGVWYTPEPVVGFIVRAVDDILKKEFALSKGLADTAKTKIKVNVQGKKVDREIHKVQILDPTAGTGTFLAQVVKQIYQNFEGQQGIWSNYIENHLLPRLNGFEILMTSYAMAHLKLDLLFTETQFKPTKSQRFRIYLTNSLEESHPDTGTLFASWLSDEANEANHIKRDCPVMVVLGNPPYSGESANKGKWIMKLMEDYKYEPGGKEKLNERNPKWINDDYVKFIRYGQHFIEKNGSGILAFINPHGYLDNPTFRGMRWHLLKTYDKIYTIDLHGNAKKKETAPDGSPDQNVFDIMQGVSINIFVKTGKKKPSALGRVFHHDLFGKREDKYRFLDDNGMDTIDWTELSPKEPNYFLVNKDFKGINIYESGFKTNELFIEHNAGLVTARDHFIIQNSPKEVETIIKEFASLDKEVARNKYKLGLDSRDWEIRKAQLDLIKHNLDCKNIKAIDYRPFDKKYLFYTNKSKGFLSYPRFEILKHLFIDNIALITTRILSSKSYNHVFISKNLIDKCSISNKGKETNYVFPLYLYPDNSDKKQIFDQESERKPNLNQEIVAQMAETLGLTFTNEKEDKKGTFAPIDILDYIYAVLHSPTYREKYKEFLKIDFPRVPYPKDKTTFRKLVNLGGQLRGIHLLESPVVEKYITKYPVDGDNRVEKPVYKNGNVYINGSQYFAGVPETAWNFYIGGYQPAQKWLKDRKGRQLGFEDIQHYQKIIVALTETDRLMKEIDRIEIE